VAGSLTNGSSAPQARKETFEVDTQSGVLSFLRAIHRSDINQDLKNDLRDAIFAYTVNGTQKNILRELSEEAGFTVDIQTPPAPIEKEVGQTKKVDSTFSRMRQVPQFTSPTHPNELVQKDINESNVVVSELQKVADIKTDVLDTPLSVPEIPQEKVRVGGEKSLVRSVTDTVKEHSVVDESEVTPAQVPTTPSPVPVDKNVENPMVRIKEIKRAVNEKVGNPISLIDTHEKIGREYMNALLAAMKTSNGGSAAEVASAMKRLEQVFETVAGLDLSKNIVKSESTASDFIEAEKHVDNSPVSGEVRKGVDGAPTAQTEVPDETSKVLESPETSTVHNEIDGSTVLESVPKSEPKIKVESEPVDVTTIDIEPKLATSVLKPEEIHQPLSSVEQNLSSVADAETAVEKNVAPSKIEPMVSVAKEEQLQKLMQQNRVKEVADVKQKEEAERSTMDPLMAPEVNAGLNQLLSEWSLFKSSGFFGTGPSGADHVLYKKLAPLTMAAVIAGRFEGSTPQIKQSITDYMNGWRYEEGVVHEHAETFEHYLKKVIRHILDKQKAEKEKKPVA